MHTHALIDALVHQTTVLIAHLATAAGVRAPLAHVADQVFLELVGALREQGVGGKVIADMFGMALRTYHARVRRLRESVSVRGQTLWAAVLAHVAEGGVVARGAVLHRFRYDDEATVRGVLNDLVESGMVFKAGRGDRTVYRAAHPDELGQDDEAANDEALVWVAINRYQPASRDDIAAAVKIDGEALDAALARLAADGRVAVEPTAAGGRRWRCDTCVIPYGAAAGWEAAVFDHFQAMVTGICTKLRQGARTARRGDAVGGSTYGFDVWAGHPLEDEVYGLLAEVRDRASALRERVEAHNAGAAAPDGVEGERLMFYVGQSPRGQEDEA